MLEEILEILKHSNVFLTGGGGVGKSYLTSAIIKRYRSELKNVIVLGSTGISAVNIGGVSVHSFFKFGICSDFNELLAYDKKQTEKLKRLKTMLDSADLIVLDEISMVSANLLEMIRLRLLNSKFSGRLLFVGDFYQLPPVKKQTKQNALFDFSYAFNASAWRDFNLTNIELKISKRTQDIKFYDILSRLRVGVIDDEVASYTKSLLVFKFEPSENTSVLFGTNVGVDRLNNFMLERIKSPAITLKAQISVFEEGLNPKRLESFKASLNVSEELIIKLGARVIFITNKWGEYYNGEQGEVMQVVRDGAEISSVIIRKENGEICEVERNNFKLSEPISDENGLSERVLASFLQFPFKLSYALTIHKSQGMSISNLTCDLNQIFANGQLYVALSRAIDPANLKLIYSKTQDFYRYLQRVVKVDEEVRKFYMQSEFKNIKESI
ncbi:ATP-dependent DNA helicase [Campylobacter mucosalis]|uniref:ATP-dependent DNA helicase n=1 Tax=Campylobacter mucosalis TaxID=202 RepID=UPI00146FD7AF|nr:AAA family ATPase [Campylobacter mucosalis]